MTSLTDPHATAVMRRQLLTLGTANLFVSALLAAEGALGIIGIGQATIAVPYAVGGCFGAVGAAVVTAAAWATRATLGPHTGSATVAAGSCSLIRVGRLAVLTATIAAAVIGLIVGLAADDPIFSTMIGIAAAVPLVLATSTAHTVARVIRMTRTVAR